MGWEEEEVRSVVETKVTHSHYCMSTDPLPHTTCNYTQALTWLVKGSSELLYEAKVHSCACGLSKVCLCCHTSRIGMTSNFLYGIYQPIIQLGARHNTKDKFVYDHS